ncbi:MAG: hypothetical protein LBD96_03495 [Treponema sp.]|jgi:hypothetical protein|nr:hypothetical protein [Treponema sp.]
MNKKLVFSAMLVMVLLLGFVFMGCDTGTGGTTGDTTAPVLSLQAVAQYGDTAEGTTATVVFTSNEGGSYYVQVLGSATAVPTVSALAESGLTGTVTVGVTTTVSITSLTKDSPYKAHVTVKDAAGNYSAVWSSDAFTPTQTAGGAITNPFSVNETWTGSGTFQGYPFTAVCEVTGTENTGTFKVTVTVAGQGYGAPPPFTVTEGTYVYKGNPVIWTVSYANSQYTTIKVGDVGIAAIDGNTMLVFNFADPIANGTYTKLQE